MKFSSDWSTRNYEVWSQFLKPYAHKELLKILEIGCFEGRSTIWLAENLLCRDGRLVAVDDFSGNPENSRMNLSLPSMEEVYRNFMSNIEEAGLKDKVILLHNSSCDALPRMKFLDYDIIYVDAGHGEKEVFSDCIMAWPLLKPSGTMILDDYWFKYNDTGKGIDSFLEIYEGQYDMLHKDYQVLIKKKSFEEVLA